MPTPEGYTVTAKALHWIMAVLILITLPAGLAMTRIGPGPWQDRLFILHKAIGPTLLVLLVLRAAWRLTHRPPPLVGLPPWQARAARATHLLLYLTLAVMVASGYTLTAMGGFPFEMLDRLGIPPLLPVNKPVAAVATAIHLATKYLLIVLIALHVAAALHHALVRRDGVFRRMWLTA